MYIQKCIYSHKINIDCHFVFKCQVSDIRFGLWCFNATFNNISVILWWSVLLVEETGVPGENHRLVTSHWQTLSHNVVSSTPCHNEVRTFNFCGDSDGPISRYRRHYGSKVNWSKKRQQDNICKHIETNLFIVAVMRISSLKEIFMNLLVRKENDLWIHLSCKYWKHS